MIIRFNKKAINQEITLKFKYVIKMIDKKGEVKSSTQSYTPELKIKLVDPVLRIVGFEKEKEKFEDIIAIAKSHKFRVKTDFTENDSEILNAFADADQDDILVINCHGAKNQTLSFDQSNENPISFHDLTPCLALKQINERPKVLFLIGCDTANFYYFFINTMKGKLFSGYNSTSYSGSSAFASMLILEELFNGNNANDAFDKAKTRYKSSGTWPAYFNDASFNSDSGWIQLRGNNSKLLEIIELE